MNNATQIKPDGTAHLSVDTGRKFYDIRINEDRKPRTRKIRYNVIWGVRTAGHGWKMWSKWFELTEGAQAIAFAAEKASLLQEWADRD